jgi:branched-chain amino acid transport system substrate-binding protein
MKRRITILMKTMGLIGLVFSLLFFSAGRPLKAEEPIKIGVVHCLTGRGGFLGTPFKEGITMMVERLNHQGGIIGKQIELYFEDDQSNPTNAALAATKLIRDKTVSAVLSASLVVCEMAMVPICESEQVPTVVFSPLTIPTKKWIFLVPPTDYRLGLRMLKFTTETLGAKKIALMHTTDTYGINGIQAFVENADKYGVSIVITEKFDPSDTSVIPQLTKVKAAHPDAIILFATSTPATVVAKNYYQLGMDTYVVGGGGMPSVEFLKVAGKYAEGGRWIPFGTKNLYADLLPRDDPWHKTLYEPFMDGMRERWGRTEYTQFYGNVNDAMHITFQGLRYAGKDDRAAIRDGLEKVTYAGFMGEYAYSPTDHDGTKGEAFGPVIVKDGKWAPFKK